MLFESQILQIDADPFLYGHRQHAGLSPKTRDDVGQNLYVVDHQLRIGLQQSLYFFFLQSSRSTRVSSVTSIVIR